MPLEWVGAQTNRGNALAVLGESETDSRRLEQAVQAYAQALAVIERERAPLRWALAQFNLANALSILGQRESGAVRLQEAVRAYEAALQEYRQERVPLLWARGSNELAYTVALIAVRTRDPALLETADRYVREARAVLGRGGDAPGLARADYVLRAIAAIRVRMAQ
jgi:tetratricopeptide (TPR) repeat protein